EPRPEPVRPAVFPKAAPARTFPERKITLPAAMAQDRPAAPAPRVYKAPAATVTPVVEAKPASPPPSKDVAPHLEVISLPTVPTPVAKPVITTFKKRDPLPPSTVKKASRATPTGQTRLYMNVGLDMGVQPGDVVGAIMGETGLSGKIVGTIDLRERHLFVDVAAEHASGIIAKLNRATIKGTRVKVKLA
ncbi:MAG: cshA, partial [Verrucomicrobiales bacterium]|nr:cshA [Verrucomicrobiales bacterium]